MKKNVNFVGMNGCETCEPPVSMDYRPRDMTNIHYQIQEYKKAGGELDPKLQLCADLEGYVIHLMMESFRAYMPSYFDDMYEEAMIEIVNYSVMNYRASKSLSFLYSLRGVTSFAVPLLDAGFEQAVKKDGTVVELSNGDERYEFTIFRTSSFEQAPDVVVNSYIYGDRYILEVMHDFKANTATLYVYDRESPDMKIAISHYDLKDGSISDSEIMAAAAPDLDDSLAALALLMSV